MKGLTTPTLTLRTPKICILKRMIKGPANPKAQPLDLAVTSILANAGNNARSRRGRSDVLALEVGQEVGVANAVERAGAAESVDLASVAESGGADGVGAGVRGGEDLAAGGAGVDGRGHVLEDVAFGDDGGAGADFEGVAAVGVPVVVDGVEERVAADFGAAAAGVVDVVALEGYEVAGAGEVQSPVVVVVAGGGPGGGTVDLRVGNSDTLAGAVSEDDVLAANEGGLRFVSTISKSSSSLRSLP